MKYRPDIDGLRALAVLPVIFFHANWSLFSGGFVGVDIFFVISGFLITGILHGDIQQKRLSLRRFYERRIRRIFPALFVVLFASIGAAYFLLMPEDFKEMGKSLVATTLFISNVFFMKASGYFDGPAHMKPLLHTWSLSVEEQFYIVFPFLLAWLRPRWIPVLLALSFLSSTWLVLSHPIPTFYLAPTRAWELLMGSVLALKLVPEWKNLSLRTWASLIGLALIAFSAIFYSSSTVFPGLAAVPPCLGAALLIHAGASGGSWVHRALAWRPLIFIGLISYPLYLWHWPIFVFLRSYLMRAPNVFESFAAIALAFVLSFASWKFLETPFRERKILNSQSSIFIFAFALTISVFFLGHWIHGEKGFSSRLPKNVKELADARLNYNPRGIECHSDEDRNFIIPYEKNCLYGKPNTEPSVAVWGDSLGREIVVTLGHQATNHGTSVMHITSSGCPAEIGKADANATVCEKHNAATFKNLIQDRRIQKIVLVQRYALRSERVLRGLEEVVPKLLTSGKQVFLVYPIPMATEFVPDTLAKLRWRGQDLKNSYIPYAQFESENREVVQRLNHLLSRYPATAIHLDQKLCNKFFCRTEFNGTPLYFDNFHLSLAGADFVGPLFEILWRKRP